MRLIVMIVLGLGICFRFVNLDHKIYWYDETFTSLRSSGYTEAEVVEHFSQSSIVHPPELQHYQQPDPQRGLGETLHSLAIEDPQHPPLYYILASHWIRWVGHSVLAMRLLPALLSLLAFPSAYWLCWEWFEGTGHRSTRPCSVNPCFTNHPGVGWMAIGLIAISPFHILYAQEAREYSLWSVTTLLATATLLRAMRVNSAGSWLIYGLALAASLYTFLFSIWLAIAHTVYVLISSKFRFSSTIVAYLVASLLALAAFSPWAWITLQNLSQIQTVTDWTTNPRSRVSLVMSWASGLGRLFYDRGASGVDRGIQVGFILLIGFAFYQLCRHTAQSVWLLLVTLTAVPTLVLVLPDVIWGGGRSTAPRYLIPTLCSLQLAVAYLLATKTLAITPTMLSLGSGAKAHHPQPWRWITAAVFTAGILSGLAIVPAHTWWTKPHNQDNLAVAQIINRAINPLVISDAETADLLSLNYGLKAETDLLVRPRCYTCSIVSPQAIDPEILKLALDTAPDTASEHSDIFIFHPRATKEWKQSLYRVQNYHPEAALPGPSVILWKLNKIPVEAK